MRSTDRPVAAPIVVDGRMIHQDQCHGVARVTIELMRHLPAQRDREVVLLLADEHSERFDIADLARHVRVERCTSAVGRPWDVRDLRRVLARIRPGVVYAPYHGLAPLPLPYPLVIGLHDTIVESDRRLAGTPARALAYRANTLRALRQARAAVVPSETTAAVLPAFYPRVPPTTVCPNGVDPLFWTATPAEQAAVRARFGLPERYVLNVGARRLHKNQRVLVEALPMLRDDVPLVLLGHHDPRVPDELDRLARSLGVAHRIIALDDAHDSALPGVYAGASVLAFPSVNEGYGLPPVEAMAAGTPVVASAIPVVAEVCGDAALLVSPYAPAQWAAALQDVLDSPALSDRLVQAGRKVAAAATWEIGAHRLFGLLDSIAGGAR